MLLVSLIGEQPIPNLLPIRFLQSSENLLLFTTQTETVAGRLQRILSGSTALPREWKVDPFNFTGIVRRLETLLAGRQDVCVNLTGGTKIMMLAAYQTAALHGWPFVYYENWGSMLYRYQFQEGLAQLEEKQPLPELIDIADYLKSHLLNYQVTGFHMENNRLSAGGCFEQAVAQTLQGRGIEVLAGVHPDGVGGQIEIDLVLRCGNQVGIAELKTGKDRETAKHGLDQLKMAGEPAYLGTFTAQFLITAGRLSPSIEKLAHERNVTTICLPDYKDGLRLNKNEGDLLESKIRQRLERKR